MTEAEWLAATGPFEWPHPLFHYVFFFGGASDRKLRLACVACCRIVEPHTGGAPFPFLIRLIEAVADGNEPDEKVGRAVTSIQSWLQEQYELVFGRAGGPTLTEQVEQLAREAILHAGSPYRDREWHVARKNYPYSCFVAEATLNAAAFLGQQAEADRTIIHILHDVFGPLPFRPIPFAPSWRTEAVVDLARGMYESRDFAPMPVLADALEDAGCADADILAHCRGDGPHVRGCWVVDLVLGKS